MRTTKTQPIARNATDSPAAHDFLGVEALLSDEERGTRERVRSFVQAMIKPNVAGSPRPKLADMLVEVEKGTLLALHLGRMKEAGP